MAMLSRPEVHDEQAAYDDVEARVWPHGATCPKYEERERAGKMGGKSTRIGTYKCYKCRKPFTEKVGTIFESSHVPMTLWLQAIHLVCASKKGISSNQLHRTLDVTLKTAWFMSHRIREAMRPDGDFGLGSGGGVVEADETLIGREPGTKLRRGVSHYATTKDHFAGDEVVSYRADEYVRGDVHTDTVEGFHSIFKRAMRGVYQHCSKKHPHRYTAEFDFRYSNRVAKGPDDKQRANIALKGIVGERLTYQTIGV